MFAVLATMYEVGVKMRCQEIIGPYIMDFTIPPKMLVVEIDDPSHKYQEEYDSNRDSYLADLGFTVLHISHREVKKQLTKVKRMIQGYRTVSKWKLRYAYAVSKSREFLKNPGQMPLPLS